MKIKTPKCVSLLGVASAVMAFLHLVVYCFVVITKGVIAYSLYTEEKLTGFIIAALLNVCVIVVGLIILVIILVALFGGINREKWNRANCIWPLALIGVWYMIHNLIPSILGFSNTYSLNDICNDAKVSFMAIDNLLTYVSTFNEFSLVILIIAASILVYAVYTHIKDGDDLVDVFQRVMKTAKEEMDSKDVKEVIKEEVKEEIKEEIKVQAAEDTKEDNKEEETKTSEADKEEK